MKKEFNHKAVMKLLFIIYMCVLVYVVFFAEAMGRTPQDGYVYNLTPLKEIKRFMRYIWDNDALGSAARLNIFGNIIAFISAIYIGIKAWIHIDVFIYIQFVIDNRACSAYNEGWKL